MSVTEDKISSTLFDQLYKFNNESLAAFRIDFIKKAFVPRVDECTFSTTEQNLHPPMVDPLDFKPRTISNTPRDEEQSNVSLEVPSSLLPPPSFVSTSQNPDPTIPTKTPITQSLSVSTTSDTIDEDMSVANFKQLFILLGISEEKSKMYIQKISAVAKMSKMKLLDEPSLDGLFAATNSTGSDAGKQKSVETIMKILPFEQVMLYFLITAASTNSNHLAKLLETGMPEFMYDSTNDGAIAELAKPFCMMLNNIKECITQYAGRNPNKLVSASQRVATKQDQHISNNNNPATAQTLQKEKL